MNSGLAQTLQASVSNDPRNKEWEDLNYDQRTDRLMEVVTRLHETVQQQAASIFELKNKLEKHEHDEDGSTFTRQYLDQREKSDYHINIPYTPHVSNPLNVKALKPKAGNDEDAVERAY